MYDPEQAHSDCLYNIRLGIRYHMRRQAFFERWNRVTGVLSLVGGATAVATMATPEVARSFAALIAVAQSIDLLVDTRKLTDLHRDLKRRYTLLEPELLDTTALNEQQYRGIQEKIKSIEIDEPPLRCAVMDIVQNETLIVSGYTEATAPHSFTKVGWWRRHLCHVI